MIVPEYLSGDWYAVVAGGVVALLDPSTPPEVVRAVWDAVPASGGLADQLEVLLLDGIARLRPFALVDMTGGRVHAALRGSVEVEVSGAEGVHVLSPGEVTTWSERWADGADEVTVRVVDAPGSGVALPVVSGVVRACAVRIPLTSGRTSAHLAEPAVVEHAAAPDRTDVVDPVDVDAATAVDLRHVTEVQAGADELEPATVVDEVAVVEPVVDEVAVVEPVVDEVAVVEPVVDEVAVVEPVVDEVAVVEPEAIVEVDLVVGGPGGPTLDEPTLDEPTLDEPLAGVVDGMPVSGVVAEAEAVLAADVADHGEANAVDDHDGLTILSSDLQTIREQLPSWAGDAVPGPFRVASAKLAPAKLMLSTGQVVVLDQAVLLGRAPQVSRVTNRELPRLVTLPSPQQDISRTHAEVRTDGDDILVTDLHSTNGVLVSRPGEQVRRLHPGEATVITLGEVVDLGDGVTFTVERGA